MKATLVMGLVMEQMRNIASRRIGLEASRSIMPCDFYQATCPCRIARVTAPEICLSSISCIAVPMRSGSFRRQADRFRLAGWQMLRECTGAKNKKAEQNRNDLPVPLGKSQTHYSSQALRRLDGLRSRIPDDWLPAEIGFVRHMTSDCGVIAEHCILGHRLARFHRLEKDIQVWAHVSPVVPAIHGVIVHGFFAELRVMLRVPLFQIFLMQFRREAVCVVAGSGIDARLRRVPQLELAGVENSLRPHEPRQFRGFRSESKTDIHRNSVIVEQHGMQVGHVAPIFEPENASHGYR